MTCARRTSVIVFTAMIAVALSCALCHAEALPPASGGTVQDDLRRQAAMLNTPSATQTQRDEAARRLVARATPETRQMLLNVLIDASNPKGQLAVARALAGDTRPDPLFINPLFALLGADRAMTEAASFALAAFRDSPEVFTRLVNFADSRQQRPVLRSATIRALGAINEKRAAFVLVEMVVRADEDLSVRNAAADALVDMTGLREYGRDAQAWQQWWSRNSAISEADFRGELLANRAARYNQLQLLYSRLTDEIESILKDRYQAASPAQQPELLMRYLKSNEPRIREIAVRLVYDDAINARVVAVTTREMLRTMVGDSSPDVRLNVALTLRAINDAAALQPLLIQLPQESDADVRIAIARALAPIGDLRAVAPLVKLLDDPSLRVAEAAAQSLREFGATLHAKDPRLAHEVALKLRSILETRTNVPEGAALREACILAVSPLRDPALPTVLYRLLRPAEAPAVRRAALKALGELGDAKFGDIIARSLTDADPRVRLEAVEALGATASWQSTEALLARMNPAEEADSSVRERAWTVLQQFLPHLPKIQLMVWAERFRESPDRRLIVLKVLAAKQLADGDFEPLAFTWHGMGEAQRKLEMHVEAAESFRKALDYWNSRHVENMITEGLIEQRLESLLAGGQYAQVARFGEQLIARNPAYQQTVGAKIRAEVDRLRQARQIDSALQLITEAKKMNPPLSPRYSDDLQAIGNALRPKSVGPETKPSRPSTVPVIHPGP